jgi:hypothetical protein
MKRGVAILCLVSLFVFGFAYISHAEIVVFAKRYFIERTTIRGQLYNTGPNAGDKVHVQIIAGTTGLAGMAGQFVGAYTIDFNCNDKWDWDKVEKAASSIAQYINKNNTIDPIKMLSEAGLSCNYAQ